MFVFKSIIMFISIVASAFAANMIFTSIQNDIVAIITLLMFILPMVTGLMILAISQYVRIKQAWIQANSNSEIIQNHILPVVNKLVENDPTLSPNPTEGVMKNGTTGK